MMTAELQQALDRVHEGGPLVRVELFQFQSDPKYVTEVRFRFQQDVVTFLAVSDDDTVTAECGEPVAPGDEGVWVDVSHQPGWSGCIGCEVAWAWAMTNQQGYTDAIRIEFENAPGHTTGIVEFVVIGSAFDFFAAREM